MHVHRIDDSHPRVCSDPYASTALALCLLLILGTTSTAYGQCNKTCGRHCQIDCDAWDVSLSLILDWQFDSDVWSIASPAPGSGSTSSVTGSHDTVNIIEPPDQTCSYRQDFCGQELCRLFDADIGASADLEIDPLDLDAMSEIGLVSLSGHHCDGNGFGEATVNMGPLQPGRNADATLSAHGTLNDHDASLAWRLEDCESCEVRVDEFIDWSRAVSSADAQWRFTTNGPDLNPPQLRVSLSLSGTYIPGDAFQFDYCTEPCGNLSGPDVPPIEPDDYGDGVVLFFSLLARVHYGPGPIQALEVLQGAVGIDAQGSLVKLGVLDSTDVELVPFGEGVQIQSPSLDFFIPISGSGFQGADVSVIVRSITRHGTDVDEDGSVCWTDRSAIIARINSAIGTESYDAAFDLNYDGVIDAGDIAVLNAECSSIDCDCDGIVDGDDYFCYLDLYNTGHATADIDGDGDVDASDFFMYLDLYSACL